MRQNATGSQPEQVLIDEKTAARRLGVSVSHLGNLRRRGGIPYVRVGAVIRYDVRALDEWIASQLKTTKEKGVDR